MDLSWRVVSGYAPHALQWIDLQAPVRGCVQASAVMSSIIRIWSAVHAVSRSSSQASNK